MKAIFLRQLLFSILILMIFAFLPAHAEDVFLQATATSFEVSPVFGDNMVFQQNEPIKVWGTSECEGEVINAQLGESFGYAVVKDNKWEITFAERSYSKQPLVLEVFGGTDSEYASFENITIGDVWWVMGQSNVEFSTSATPDWADFSAGLSGDVPVILYEPGFTAYNNASHTRWRKLSKYSAHSASALSCFLAKRMADATSNEIPFAMVTMGYAGRELASFMPPELSENISYFSEKSDIYEDVVEHLMKMPIKGLVWYQGEADAALYSDYKAKFSSYINWLRTAKNQINYNFPIYCVELYPCFNDENDPDRQYLDFGNVRAEACGLTAEIENFYVCVTNDLWNDKGYSNNLHPTNKSTLANRLSAMILSKEYGFGNEPYFFGPSLKTSEISQDGKTVTLTFNNVGEALNLERPDGFVLIDKDWNDITDFKIEQQSADSLKITADKKICILKYNCSTNGVFKENLFLSNSIGIPAAAFSCLFSYPDDTARALEEQKTKEKQVGLIPVLKTIFSVVIIYLVIMGAYILICRKRK